MYGVKVQSLWHPGRSCAMLEGKGEEAQWPPPRNACADLRCSPARIVALCGGAHGFLFDGDTGAVVRRHIIDREMIYKEILPEKLVWGSDCDVTHMSRELTAWMDAFNKMGMSADDQDKIFYRNAAAIFGVE